LRSLDKLISTLLALYDTTVRQHILDMHVWTFNPFFAIFKTDRLRVFAGENYFCAQSLLEWVETSGGHAFLLTNEYPFARSILGLYGGVLKAILAEKLSTTQPKTLGGLITEAYKRSNLVVGTRLWHSRQSCSILGITSTLARRSLAPTTSST
jgi:hypothetical protein